MQTVHKVNAILQNTTRLLSQMLLVHCLSYQIYTTTPAVELCYQSNVNIGDYKCLTLSSCGLIGISDIFSQRLQQTTYQNLPREPKEVSRFCVLF